MRIYITIISILLISIIGCHKDELLVNPQNDINGIIPLAKGNKWSFSYFEYDSLGSITRAFPNLLKFTVIGDTIINGYRWYKFSNKFWSANTKIGFTSDGYDGRLLIFKYPDLPQDSFYVNSAVNYVHILSIDTLITTSLGTFHCYAYDSHQLVNNNVLGGSYEVMFVSPQIGIVKFEIYASFRIGQKQYLCEQYELSSVTLN